MAPVDRCGGGSEQRHDLAHQVGVRQKGASRVHRLGAGPRTTFPFSQHLNILGLRGNIYYYEGDLSGFRVKSAGCEQRRGVCTGALVDFEQMVRERVASQASEEDAASVCGYTGALLFARCVRVPGAMCVSEVSHVLLHVKSAT